MKQRNDSRGELTLDLLLRADMLPFDSRLTLVQYLMCVCVCVCL